MPELKVRIGCVVLAIVMSAVTYYFVEPRLRWGRFGGYKAAGLLSVMVAVGVAGYSIERHEGYTARMNDPEQAVIDAINSRMKEDNERCLSVIPDWHSDENDCLLQRSPGENTVAIIGDSHARHLYWGLAAETKANEGIAVFPASCGIPLVGLRGEAHMPRSFDNVRLLEEAFSYILSHKNIRKVVLSHNPECSWNDVVDTKNPEQHDFQAILHEGFTRTYDALAKAGKEIYVIWDNPFHPHANQPKCAASVVKRPVGIPDFMSSNKKNICFGKRSYLVHRQIQDNWNTVSQETATGYNVHFIDLEEVFCRKGICSMLDEQDNLLYRDGGHLNIKGSIYAAPFIMKHLRQ